MEDPGQLRAYTDHEWQDRWNDGQQERHNEQVLDLLNGARTGHRVNGGQSLLPYIVDNGVEQNNDCRYLREKEKGPDDPLPTGGKNAADIAGGAADASIENQLVKVPQAQCVCHPVRKHTE